MRSFFRRAAALAQHPAAFAAFLLALCLAAYAPLIPRLGFYWDDFPISWIAAVMGGDGLERYFSTNRPVWGLIYLITTPILGSSPLAWQVFALLMRWVTGLCLWWLLRLVWGKPAPVAQAVDHQKASAARQSYAGWAAALFVLYPGFSQQFIAFLYSHFYIVLTAFLLSLALMLLAARAAPPLTMRPARRLLLTAGALLLGLLNLLSMEYFFLLDLLRPLLLWFAPGTADLPARRRLAKVALIWLPYLLLFAAAMYWRSVLFGFQTYQPALMSRLRADPLAAIGGLIPVVLGDLWKTSAGAWARAFTLPEALELGTRNMQRYWLIILVVGLASAVFLVLAARGRQQPGESRSWWTRWRDERGWAWQPFAVGLAALLIAGGPFWLTDLPVGLVFPNDRFTIPFMLGASTAAAALLALLPIPRRAAALLLAVCLAFAAGRQYANAEHYNLDWSLQRSMFWQMTWRMPDLQPGTTLLSNELPMIHYSDNSLTAPLNWIYGSGRDEQTMEYILLYPTLRKAERLNNFQKDTPIRINYLAATFEGSTAQIVSFYYQPPGCLRVLDPEVDIYNWMVPEYLRESLALSTTTPILPQAGTDSPPRPPAHIYGAEIARGWCYYFEKADLARQMQDWQAVADLGDQAFATGDYPNDPLERFPFIEGYAHTGNWQRAVELSRETHSFSPVVMQPMTCKLWERIARETPSGSNRDTAVEEIRSEMGCASSP